MEHRLEKNNHQIWLKINTHIYKKKTQKTSIFTLLLWCLRKGRIRNSQININLNIVSGITARKIDELVLNENNSYCMKTTANTDPYHYTIAKLLWSYKNFRAIYQTEQIDE